MSHTDTSMEELDGHASELEPDAAGPPTPGGDSLAGRMRAQRRKAEAKRTELFPLPGWEDFVAVELRMVGFEACRKIAARHERMRNEALAFLYTACDQLIAATVAFHEVLGDGHTETPHTWVTLARGVVDKLPENLSPRQAILALIQPDTRAVRLWELWSAWQNGERASVDEEVAEDFETTG